MNSKTRSVCRAARAFATARKKIDAKGAATDAVWNAIERAENRLLRAVERLAGIERLSLGERDSK